jgi:hypothetical protein
MAEILVETVIALNSFGDPTDIADETLLLRKITVYEDGQVDTEDIVLEGITEEIESEEGQEDKEEVEKAQKFDSDEGRWVTIRGNRVFIRGKGGSENSISIPKLGAITAVGIIGGVVVGKVVARKIKAHALVGQSLKGKVTTKITIDPSVTKKEAELFQGIWKTIPESGRGRIIEVVVSNKLENLGRNFKASPDAAGFFNLVTRQVFINPSAGITGGAGLSKGRTIRELLTHEIGHSIFVPRFSRARSIVRTLSGQHVTLDTRTKRAFTAATRREKDVSEYAKFVRTTNNSLAEGLKDPEAVAFMKKYTAHNHSNETFAEMYRFWINRDVNPERWANLLKTNPKSTKLFFAILKEAGVT